MSKGSKKIDSEYGRDDRRSKKSESSLVDRVFVGNINAKNASYRDIQEWMSKYGEVLDVVLFDRHVLVQFDRESEAQKAIEREKGRSFQGCRFEIRLAYPSDGSFNRSEQSRSKSPRSHQYSRDSRGLSPGPKDSARERSPGKKDRYYEDSRDNSSERRNYDHPMGSNEERSDSNSRSDYNSATHDSKKNAQAIISKIQTNQTNFEAAIVAISSDLLNYAESVEMKLQSQIGFTTHIVVLKEEAHVNACIDDLEKKGVLYAFLINHLNEKHFSCTLRILYGSGQEHRNMLLANALSFVSRNYDDYQKLHKSKPKLTKPGDDPTRMPAGFIAPDDKIIYQLHLLADSRMLTVDELDEIDEFLQKRIHGLAQADSHIDNLNQSVAMSGESMQLHSMKGAYGGNAPLAIHQNQSNYTLNKEPGNCVNNSGVYGSMDALMLYGSNQSEYTDGYEHVGGSGNQYMHANAHPFRATLRGMPQGNQFVTSYPGFSNQSQMARPVFRQRAPLLSRPQYPGY